MAKCLQVELRNVGLDKSGPDGSYAREINLKTVPVVHALSRK